MPVCAWTRFGQGRVGRGGAPDIDDQVRLEAEDRLDIGGPAAPGQAAIGGQIPGAGRQIGPLLRRRAPDPADHPVGRETVEQDRGRRSGRQDAGGTLRHLDDAPRRIGERPRLGRSADPQTRQGGEADHENPERPDGCVGGSRDRGRTPRPVDEPVHSGADRCANLFADASMLSGNGCRPRPSMMGILPSPVRHEHDVWRVAASTPEPARALP